MPAEPLPWSREKDVLALFAPLGKDNVFHHYLELMRHDNGSPLWYHVGGVFAFLSAIAPDYWCVPNGTRTTYPNIFALNLGRSGDGKSVAMKYPQRFITDHAAHLVGQEPVSGAAVVKGLAAAPKQILFLSEMTAILQKTAGNAIGPVAEIKSRWIEAWDASPMTYRASDATQTYVVPNPRMTGLFATTETGLSGYSSEQDYQGGLYSRIAFFYAYAERRVRLAVDKPLSRSFILQWVNHVWNLPPEKLRSCEGVDAAALDVLYRWDDAVAEVFNRRANHEFNGVHSRFLEHALKYALLLSLGLGYGQAQPGADAADPWWIDEFVANAAAELALRSLVGTVAAYLNRPTSQEERDQDRVRSAIEDTGSSFAQILRTTRMSKRRAAEVVDTLLAAGLIKILSASGAPESNVYTHAENLPAAPGIPAAVAVWEAIVEEHARLDHVAQAAAVKVSNAVVAGLVAAVSRPALLSFDFTNIRETPGPTFSTVTP